MDIKKHIGVIILLQLCLLSFSQDVIVCQGDTFKFNSVSSNTSNFVEWDFVNGPDVEIISGQNTDSLTVKFNETGNYTLQFREYALPECFGYVEQNIEVVSNPLANFSNGAICIYDSIKFFNNSSAIDGIQSSIWRIGDFVYNGLNLTYTFDETGDYVIELSVESNNGCSDKFDMSFKLSDRPKASFYFSPEHPSSLSPIVTFNNTSLNGINLDLKRNVIQEGFAYRLMPVLNPNSGSLINTELMYSNMLNNSHWRELDNENAYFSEDHRGFIMNYRSTFNTLIRNLINDGDYEKALEVINKSIELIPDKSIMYDHFSVQLVEFLLDLKIKADMDTEELANKIAEVIANRSDELLNYYFDNKIDDRYEIQKNLVSLNTLARAYSKYTNPELSKKYRDLFENNYSRNSVN